MRGFLRSLAAVAILGVVTVASANPLPVRPPASKPAPSREGSGAVVAGAALSVVLLGGGLCLRGIYLLRRGRHE